MTAVFLRAFAPSREISDSDLINRFSAVGAVASPRRDTPSCRPPSRSAGWQFPFVPWPVAAPAPDAVGFAGRGVYDPDTGGRPGVRCGCSSTVERRPSKPMVRVRFPSPAFSGGISGDAPPGAPHVQSSNCAQPMGGSPPASSHPSRVSLGALIVHRAGHVPGVGGDGAQVLDQVRLEGECLHRVGIIAAVMGLELLEGLLGLPADARLE